MKFLRDKCGITREGVSLKDISRVSEEIGLRTLPLKVTYDDLFKKNPLTMYSTLELLSLLSSYTK